MNAPKISLKIPPTMSSLAGSADLLKMYAQAIARDVPFINYDTDLTIALLLDNTHMNDPVLLANLQNNNAIPFTTESIFRGNTWGETFGPYISQYLLLNVPIGGLIVKQLYATPPTRDFALANNFRVEWEFIWRKLLIFKMDY